jgi:hypothetical protein
MPMSTNRRRFLAAAAPLAAAPALARAEADAAPRREADAAILDAARAYARLVPAWTEAARDAASARRFAAIDRSYDAAKRHLLRLMRQADRPVVVDREAGTMYVDCSPAGSHEDLDRNFPEFAVVRIVPLAG